MQKRRWIPSPPMAVALLALFVAIGGTAFAIGKDTVGAKQIKPDAVGASEIKAGAVGNSEIANDAVHSDQLAPRSVSSVAIAPEVIAGFNLINNTLSGLQIDESSLGQVPSAAVANRTNEELIKNNFQSAQVGDTTFLGSFGPFRVEGHCTDDEAHVILTTSAPGSSANSFHDELDNANFNPDTDVELGFGADTVSNHFAMYGRYYDGFAAAAPDGASVFMGHAGAAVKVLGAPCSFWLDVDQIH
jgi:hypothetical protein